MKNRLILGLFALLLVLSVGAVAQAAPNYVLEVQPADEEEIDIEEWLRIEGDGVALTLPLNFQGGDIEEVIDLISENADMLGPEFEQIFALVEQNPELFRFYAFDPDVLPSGGMTNVNITATPLPMELDMEDILDLSASQYPSSMEIVESDVVELGEYEDVGRLVIEADVMGLEQVVLQYILLIDETLYSVTYTTSGGAFEDYLPIFEASAETFEIIEDK